MNNDAWTVGMSELLTLPSRDETPERMAIRGVVFRRELGGLSDEVWLGAVRLAIQRERWFPTVAAMLAYAKEVFEAPPVMDAGRQIPSDTRTVEEKRADFRRGFQEQLRPALCEHGIHIDCEHQAEAAGPAAVEGRA